MSDFVHCDGAAIRLPVIAFNKAAGLGCWPSGEGVPHHDVFDIPAHERRRDRMAGFMDRRDVKVVLYYF